MAINPEEKDSRETMDGGGVDSLEADRLDLQRRQLLSIFESIDDPVYVSDPEKYEILYANSAFQRLMGEGVGRKCHEVIENRDSPCPFCTNPIVFGESLGRSYVWEHKNTKNNRWFRCMGTAIHWPDGRLVRCAIGSDITERKEAEQALRESEERFRIAVDNIPDVFVIYDENLRYQFVNKRAVELVGRPEKEILGRANEEVLPPEVASSFLPILERARETRTVQRAECSIPLPGGMRELIITYVPLLDDMGSVKQIFGFAHEITQRKRLEVQRRRTQKLEAIATMAGGMAHDFNNVLATIIGYAEMALDDLPKWHPVYAQIDEVFKAASRGKELVRQILALTRMGGHEERVVCDIPAITRKTVQSLEGLLPPGIEIHQECDGEQCTALAAPGQICQVLANLCMNAAHAMEEAGGIIQISLTNVDLDAHTAAHCPDMKVGPYVKLSVKDRGTGMDRATVERIFDPYFTTKPVGKGSGLGLAVVLGIVKRHGGAIHVHSRKGEGSLFEVFLPRIETNSGIHAPVERDPRGTETILFVDDEEVLVCLYQKVLERLGYGVTALTSSMEALEVFQKTPHRFDLVIADCTMPHLIGDDLVKEVHRLRPGLPVLLTVESGEGATGEPVKQIGAVECIEKPFSAQELAERIRTLLDSPCGPP